MKIFEGFGDRFHSCEYGDWVKVETFVIEAKTKMFESTYRDCGNIEGF